MIEEYKTDLEFKDNRHYVHSSTLIEASSKLIYREFYPRETWEMPKVDARFHSEILSNGVFKVSEDIAVLDKEKPASAILTFYDKSKNISAIFVEDKTMNISRRIKTNYAVDNITLEGDFCGECIINCSSSAALIENIIEANKRLHLLTLKAKKDNLTVTNLYMKTFPVSLPVEKMGNVGKVSLKIENIGARYREGSVVTLNSLYFPGVNIESFEISYMVFGV